MKGSIGMKGIIPQGYALDQEPLSGSNSAASRGV